jgi:hypothetical protein
MFRDDERDNDHFFVAVPVFVIRFEGLMGPGGFV